MTAVVNKGDVISISPTIGEEALIKWQQDFAERNKIYRVVPFLVKETGASGTLFISSSMSSKLLDMCEKDEDDNPFAPQSNYKVTVNDDFQYGQDDAGNPQVRFLVFHDKSNKMYQHRFMQTTAFGSVMSKISDVAEESNGVISMIPSVGPMINGIISKVTDMGKAYIGDNLRNF